MKLSPSTIAANLSAAAAAEAEAAANSNSTSNVTSTNTGVTTATNANTSLNHTSTKPMNQSNTSSKLTPKDTQVIATILKEMGIVEYEPRVLPQLVEFAYSKLICIQLIYVNILFHCRICITCFG